jgi:molybdenum cofactor cytidylyltransferase
MGRDKALLPWPPVAHGSTLLTASIAALKPFAEAVIVVAGNNFERLAPLVDSHGASIVQNPTPERGQFSSLQIGLRELVARGYDAAMITLVDCPPLSAVSMQRLCNAFDQARARGMWSVAPEHGGRRGHPLLVGRELIDAFLGAAITSNARTVKHEHTELIESVSVPDVLLTVDLNTPEQYEALIPRENNQP